MSHPGSCRSRWISCQLGLRPSIIWCGPLIFYLLSYQWRNRSGNRYVLAIRHRDTQRFYCAMHYSAKRGIAIACRPSVYPSVYPFVCDVGDLWSHRLEILKTNCTETPGILGLRSQKAIHLVPGKHGEILGRLEVGQEKSGVLENIGGNISETRKDRRKVTMDGL